MRGIRTALAVIPALAITLSGGVALAATSHGHAAARPATVNALTHRATAATHHRTAASQTMIITCLQKGQIRPSSYMIACGDGSQYLAKLRWASWTRDVASGTGEYSFNTCTPSCAQGKYITSKVLAVLWHTTAVPHHTGMRAFTRLTIIYTGKRPAHSAQSFTQTLWYPVIG
jgi:hypothetical protein